MTWNSESLSQSIRHRTMHAVAVAMATFCCHIVVVAIAINTAAHRNAFRSSWVSPRGQPHRHRHTHTQTRILIYRRPEAQAYPHEQGNGQTEGLTALQADKRTHGQAAMQAVRSAGRRTERQFLCCLPDGPAGGRGDMSAAREIDSISATGRQSDTWWGTLARAH